MTILTASPLIKLYSLEEFWELPEPEDHSKLELIAGVLYMTPPPGYTHDNIVSRLNFFLARYLFENKTKGSLYVPRAAIWTSPNTYLEPDLFYVSAELEAKMDPKYRTSADLVIEVISPGSSIYDKHAKADTYAALGVKELWLIDETSKTVEVRQNTGSVFGLCSSFRGEETLQSSVFPHLNFLVKSLFQD
ncbi:MAG: Uma2 family endonuclease [Planctomycetota bacterium]